MDTNSTPSEIHHQWEGHWPEDVLRIIFSELPFPEVLKVALLSRRWRHLFADLVCDKWSQYCPVLLRYSPDYLRPPSSTSPSTPYRSSNLVAFNRKTNQWEHVPLRRSIAGSHFQTNFVRMLGSFLVEVYSYVGPSSKKDRKVYSCVERVRVASLFTGEIIELPEISELEVKMFVSQFRRYGLSRRLGGYWLNLKLLDVVLWLESKEFRVMLIYRGFRPSDETYELIAFEFGSSEGIWKRKFRENSQEMTTQRMVVEGTNIYTTDLDLNFLWRHELQGFDTSRTGDGESTDSHGETDEDESDVLVCSYCTPLSRKHNIIYDHDYTGLVMVDKAIMALAVDDKSIARVYQVNEDTSEIIEVSSHCAHEFLSRHTNIGPYKSFRLAAAADGGSIFLWPGDGTWAHELLVYNVTDKTWDEICLDGDLVRESSLRKDVESSWEWMLVGGSGRRVHPSRLEAFGAGKEGRDYGTGSFAPSRLEAFGAGNEERDYGAGSLGESFHSYSRSPLLSGERSQPSKSAALWCGEILSMILTLFVVTFIAIFSFFMKLCTLFLKPRS